MPGLLTPVVTGFAIKFLVLSIIQFTVVSEKELHQHFIFFFITYSIAFISCRCGVGQSFNRCARIEANLMMCCFIAVNINMF